MRKLLVPALIAAALTRPSFAQNTDYNGGAQDPAQMKTYRYDVGILTLNIQAPGVSQQASNVILQAGSQARIVIQVQSNSDFILDGYNLIIKVDGRPFNSVKQDGIRPHDTVTSTIPLPAAFGAGPHQVSALLVPLGHTDEDNPRNNVASISFTVEGSGGAATDRQADLVVDHITPNTLSAMDKTIIEIAIGNQGGVDVNRPVELEVTVGGSTRRVRTTTGVPAGKSAFASIELHSDVWARNPHCTVRIDPSNEVNESNKANNTRSI
jgi:hypothetical protein